MQDNGITDYMKLNNIEAYKNIKKSLEDITQWH